MATDATTAPATTASEATPAPAATQATQTAAPAAGAATASEPFDFGKLVAERLGKKPAATPAPAKAETAPSETAAQDPVKAEPEKPATEPAKVEAKKPEPADDISARLKALHEANARAAEARKAQRRQADVEAKLKAAEGAHAKEIALAQAIEEARTKRDFVGLLKAAGFTIDEIKNSPLIVDMVDQFGKLDEDGADKPKPITESDVERMLREREEAAEKERKEKAEAAKREREEAIAASRNEYYGYVKVEFKAGDYPALKRAGVTMGGLEQYRADYVARNPNHAPNPKELLDLAEKDLRALWKRNAEHLAALEGGTATAAAKPTEFVPSSTVKPKRTVTSNMQAGVGGTAPSPAPAVKKSYREKEQDMRNEFVARFAK